MLHKATWKGVVLGALLVGTGCNVSEEGDPGQGEESGQVAQGIITTTYTLNWPSNESTTGDICRFGNTSLGHQAATNAYASGRLEEPLTLSGLAGRRITSIRLTGNPTNFKYDDVMLLAYNNHLLMASDRRVAEYSASPSSPGTAPVVYSWANILNRLIDNENKQPAWCTSGASPCSVPPTQTYGTMDVNISSFRAVDEAAYPSAPATRTFRLVTIGDNDPSIDCRHGPVSLTVTVTHEPAPPVDSIVGDDDGFGTGLPCGFSYSDINQFTPEPDDPLGMDVITLTNAYTPPLSSNPYVTNPRALKSTALTHQLSIPAGCSITTATLRMCMADIDDQPLAYVDDQLFIDGQEVPGAFDNVNQLISGLAGFTSIVEFNLAPSLFPLLADGRVSVLVDERNRTTTDPGASEAFAIDYSRLIVSYTCQSSHPVSCKAILDSGASRGSGVYTIDVDGAGSVPPVNVYCDMTTDGGGWTLVLNQVPGQPLPNQFTTAFPENVGSLTASFRLGREYTSAIRPATAWRMTDGSNQVYFRPACIVDWANDLHNQPIGNCNIGYTSSAFTTPVSSVFSSNYSRGLGQNNSGQHCSIRAYQSLNAGSFPAGVALGCNHQSYTSQTIRLWYR